MISMISFYIRARYVNEYGQFNNNVDIGMLFK